MSGLGQPYSEELRLGESRLMNRTQSDYFMRLRGARMMNGLDLPPVSMNDFRSEGSFGTQKAQVVQASVGVLDVKVTTYDAGNTALQLVSFDAPVPAAVQVAQTLSSGSGNLSEATSNDPAVNEPVGVAAEGTEEGVQYSAQQAANDAEYAAQQAIIAGGAAGAAAAATYEAQPVAEPTPDSGYVEPGVVADSGGGSVAAYAPPPPTATYEPQPVTYEEWAQTQSDLEQLVVAGVY